MGAGTGPQIAAYLTEAYHNKLSMCRNNPSAPAFLCSGVMLRATQHSAQFHFWNPNPTSTGVSFSYLRADAKFSRLVFGYNNGFILYPYFFKPVGKIEPQILCFFPVDGGTTHREQEGCGQTPGIASSRPCQVQGITTAAQYITHYNQQPNKYGQLCGFDVRDDLNQAATTAFNEAIKAQGLGGTFAFNTQNEFRLAKWGQNLGTTLPIEAVFYINDTGKAGAQYDQRDFKSQTGIWIPAIRITLPQTPTADVRFEFIAGDQAISS
ncbi:hypothetical protein [Pseudomonas sp. HMWF021]|uniref:hypothetical protein n=1 Tax=Pseudomonas sp. HMWF021 TaxID=2056857 RepID=UPI0021152D95|nr:hypothetical protein [Pseudomonas sp. HMWF021]